MTVKVAYKVKSAMALYQKINFTRNTMLRGKFHDLIHNFVYVVGCAAILFRMGIVVATEPYYNYINEPFENSLQPYV